MPEGTSASQPGDTGAEGRKPTGSPGAARPGLLTRCAGCSARFTDRTLDRVIAVFTVVFSKDGLAWIGALLLLGGALFGWLQTPLQGVICGYAYPVFGRVGISDALGNHARVLSYGVLCLAGVGLVVLGAARGWPVALRRHLGAALLLALLSFAVSLVTRQGLLLEAVINQAGERANIIGFASSVGGYAGVMLPSELPGTSTLLDRALTAYDVIGYGWWFAFWGTILLLAAGYVRAGRTRPGRFAAGWGALTLLVLAAVAGPAVVAEYHRVRAEGHYGRAQYAQAVEHLAAAVAWLPALRANPSVQDKIGAALYWLGDRSSPQVRIFLADNLQAQGDFDRAELELSLAVAADPDWSLARRRLAEVNAAWGVRLFRSTESGAIPRWERALEIDDSLKQVRYYLAHAYYTLDDRDQSRALTRATQFVELVQERGVLADMYQRLGDMYFRARRDEEARQMYRLSIVMIPLVKQLNLQAQRGLIGL